jgi:hypothetical protein
MNPFKKIRLEKKAPVPVQAPPAPKPAPEPEAVAPPVPLFQTSLLQKLQEYLHGSPKELCFVEGPTGCGKSMLMEYLAYQQKAALHVYQGEEDLEEILHNRSIHRNRILVIDDIEVETKYQKDLLHEKAIVLVCNLYDTSYYRWKNKFILRMHKYTNKEIIEMTGCSLTIAEESRGDIRKALLMKKYASAQDDLGYDLFRTANLRLRGTPVQGLQSNDVQMLTSLFQWNLPTWAGSQVQTYSALCQLDCHKYENNDFYNDYLNAVMDAYAIGTPRLEMPKFVHKKKDSNYINKCI